MTTLQMQAPCQYSVEELNKRAQQAMLDYEMKKNIIPHNQINRKKTAV